MNVVITGTSRGIGLELVKIFTGNKKNRVIALSRNIEPLKNLKAGKNLQYLSFDLGRNEPVQKLNELVEKHLHQKVDILINNAGLLIKKPFSQFLSEDFDQLFATNVKGPVQLIQNLLPYLIPGSHIVNIGSMGGYQGSVKFPGLSLYASSKGALAVLSECLAVELQPQNIFVNALAIGAVDTEMLNEAFPGYQSEVTPSAMASYIADFAMTGHKVYNGKILPVSLSTP
ncbi:MAG: SDR family oxidoreductase [Bacteroidales bacterium]|nr:SDR family oxidoreductase [Bacteroidales bacterium]